MKIAVISTLLLMLLASSAYAAGSAGSVVVDIVGSTAENTEITTSGAGPIELEIVGSKASNTKINPFQFVECIVPCCPCCCCPAVSCDYEATCSSISEERHMGVDAWYGTFWYTPFDHLPKWPHI